MQVIFVIVAAYLAVIFAVGIYASRYVNDSTDFLLAGQRLGPVLLIGTLAATHLGGGFVVGISESSYETGMSGISYAIGLGLGLVLLGLVVAGPMRSLAIFTVPDYLEHRYGSKLVRGLAALLSLVAIVGIIAAQVGATAGALGIMGVSPQTGAIVATILFIVYTAASGMWGVTLTDGIQVLVILFGLPVAAILALQQMGGLGALQEGVAQAEIGLSASEFLSPLGGGWSLLLGATVPAIMYTLIGQDFYQRLLSARDARTARLGALVSGVVLVALGVFPALIGIAARLLYPELADSAQALPTLVTEVLPVWAGAVVVAAIVAAVTSTANSLLTAGTSHIVNDIYKHLLGGADDTRKMLALSRVFTLVLGVAALLFAIAASGIIDALIYSYTMYASGVFVPVVAGLLWWRGTAAGAVAGIAAGAIAGLLGVTGIISYGGVPEIMVGGLVSLVAYVAVSLMTKPNTPGGHSEIPSSETKKPSEVV